MKKIFFAVALLFAYRPASACMFINGYHQVEYNIESGYCVTAGRSPTYGERQYWGSMPGVSVAGIIMNYYKSNLSAYEEMVQKAYRDHLDRNASSAEIAAWKNNLLGGQAARYTDIVRAIRSTLSQMILTNPAAFDDMIVRAYQKGAGRNPSTEEVQNWRYNLKLGYTFHDMVFAVVFYFRNPGKFVEIRVQDISSVTLNIGQVNLYGVDSLTQADLKPLVLPEACYSVARTAMEQQRALVVRGIVAERFTPSLFNLFGYSLVSNVSCNLE